MTAPASNPQPGPAPASPQKPADKTIRKLGNYELLSKIGQGAMGAVYLARHMTNNRQVALKVLPHELARDEEFLERFRREARAALKISHPNIVSAYDIGVADGFHYIAMEYVDGKDLESLLEKKGRFAEAELLKICLEVCAALEAAHDKGIVHRDIKPSNILLTSAGVAKVIDLGLSTAGQDDRRVTIAGYAVGTPYYISPEQAKGTLQVDHRADFYGLGATMYHLATGEVPFPGNNAVVIMSQHISENPPLPHERNPNVSRRLSLLIQRMMSKDPDRRYQNARELRLEMERVLRGEMPAVQSLGERKKLDDAAKARAAEAAKAAAVPQRPLDERILLKVDELLVFLPASLRVPIAAVTVTLLLLIGLALLVALLRRG